MTVDVRLNQFGIKLADISTALESYLHAKKVASFCLSQGYSLVSTGCIRDGQGCLAVAQTGHIGGFPFRPS